MSLNTQTVSNRRVQLASRMNEIPRSFLREILKVAQEPGMISLAGGLPDKDLFPVNALKRATNKIFDEMSGDALQYNTSEGLPELRQLIAERYRKRGTPNISPDNILITNGSQQALDLIAKILVNEGDGIILEEPSYLGAIQAFSLYEPKFMTVPLTADGLDIEALEVAVNKGAKMMYVIPNFQNPSGITYSEQNRRRAADVLRGTQMFLIEDDPYGEIRFSGEPATSFKNLIPDQTVLLGSFSKTLVPGFRLGWVVVPDVLLEKLTVAKQAADLHTSSFSQYVVCEYLRENDTSAHIAKIAAKYASHKNAMVQAIQKYFPKSVSYTNPDGGMFLWITMPREISAIGVFESAVKEGVCIVPGHPFYIGKEDVCTARLSYSCVDEATIAEAIRRLGIVLCSLCAQ